MSFNINNSYTGTFFGKDRLGHTTPNPVASDVLRPWLTVPYPAPYLPGARRDEGHPVGESIVLSDGYAVGLDKNNALVPAGLFSGTQKNIADGGSYCMLVYGADDVGFVMNAATGSKVAAAGEYVLLAAPANAYLGATGITCTTTSASTTVTIAAGSTPDKQKLAPGQSVVIAGLDGPRVIASVAGDLSTFTITVAANAAVTAAATTWAPITVQGKTITPQDLAFAKACDLLPATGARSIGYAVRNVFRYLGGVNVFSTTGGVNYKLTPDNPTGYAVHNYMNEPGTAIQTQMILRLPWIGATRNRLNELAAADGIVGYSHTDFDRSFVHFTGAKSNVAGGLFPGCLVVPSTEMGDAGHYAPFNPAAHTIDQVCGRVIGIESMYPIRDFVDRVRTQFDRAESFVGPFADKHPNTFLMGGSATRGMDYQINLGTGGIFRKAKDQGKPIYDEYGTYVYVHFRA